MMQAVIQGEGGEEEGAEVEGIIMVRGDLLIRVSQVVGTMVRMVASVMVGKLQVGVQIKVVVGEIPLMRAKHLAGTKKVKTVA